MNLPDGDLAVVAEPTRARILGLMLTGGDRVLVGRLAERLGLRQPTVSHHMKALLAAGIVTREPEGRRAWYRIADGRAERVAAVLGLEAAPAGLGNTAGPDEQDTPAPDLERIAADLAVRFRGRLDDETVSACVRESHELLRANAGRELLASRTAAFAASRLDALAPGKSAKTVGYDRAPRVLFVCVRNAGRSQLAAAILRHLGGDRVSVATAGSEPGGEVQRPVVAVLDEIGVPVSGEFPKPLTDEAVRAADVVVTMGCGDACPVYPGRRYLDWDLADPDGRPLDEVRAIRDDVDARVRDLHASLIGA